MKKICKNCAHCYPTYKGGSCDIKKKKIKLQGTCEEFREKVKR